MTDRVVFPTFTQEGISTFEMRQLVQALEIRFQALETDQLASDAEGDFAPLVHTHSESDITDLGSYLEDITGESVFDLSDFDGTPIDGQVPIWNGTAFTPGSLGDAIDLNDLDDVNVGGPNDGDAVRWNATSQLWEAQSLGDALAVDLDGQADYDLLFNRDDVWEDTGGELQWNPDLDYLQLANNHSLNWRDTGFVSRTLLNFDASEDFRVGHVSYDTRLIGNLVRTNNEFRVYDSTDTDFVAFRHNGTTFLANGVNTSDFQFQGMSFVDIAGGTDLRVVGGGAFEIRDATNAELVDFSHDGVDFSIDASSGTQDLRFLDFTQVNFFGGAQVGIWDAANTDRLQMQHDGIDFNFDFANTADWNITGISAINIDSGIRIQTSRIDRLVDNSVLNIFGGDGTGANVELYGSTHASNPNRAFYDAVNHTFRDFDSTPTYAVINSSGINVTGDVSGTTIGGITEANLLDRSVNETVDGAWTFTFGGSTVNGIEMVSNNPWFGFSETDEGVDAKNWRWGVNSRNFRLFTSTDASPGTPVVTPISVIRNANSTSIAQIALNAANLEFNGNADVSGSLDVEGGVLELSGNFVEYRIRENDAAADEGLWTLGSHGSVFTVRTRTDTAGFGADAIRVSRTLTAINEVELNATVLDFNGDVDLDGEFQLFESGITKFWVDHVGDKVDIRDGYNLLIRDAADTDWASFGHDGIDFNTSFTNTTDWDITGITRLNATGVNLVIQEVRFDNVEAVSAVDGAVAFDASEGLLIHRLQQVGDVSGDDNYVVLDRSNIAGGSNLTISGGVGSAGAPITFDVDANPTFTSVNAGNGSSIGAVDFTDTEQVMVFDGGDAMITVHDGFGNFNIKSGVDHNNVIVGGVAGGTHIRMDARGSLYLRSYSGAVSSTAVTSAEILLNDNGTVTVGAGEFIVTNRFLTKNPSTGDTSAMQVDNHGGTSLDVGFNVLDLFNNNVSDTLEAQHCGAANNKNSTTARTLTLASSTDLDFPVLGVTTVINSGSSGDYTINEGSGTQLIYVEPGVGGTDTAGGCTIGPGGVATIWRITNALYYIWGSEITP